jgi:peptidyl-prolyl cis-trans isomerase D
MLLQNIRDRLTGILAFVILGILVIPFAFVGVNSYFQSGNENLVAMVDDQEITFTEFNQSFLDYRRRMQSIMGEAYDPEQYDSPIARREHLDRMIDERLLADAAVSMKLDVDNGRLAEQIRQIPAFQVEGVFNTEVYQSRLASQGMTVPQFEAQMRSQMLLSQLPYGVSGSSFATDHELAEMVALTRQTRSFDAVVFANAPEAVSQDVDEAAMQAWYESHRDRFMTEEQVVIQYVELDAAGMAVDAEPDEELLRSRFEAQKGRFLSPERRLVSHVLIEVSPDADDVTRETARQLAEDVAERARTGEDFAALAQEFSQDVGSASLGGDLGWVEPGVAHLKMLPLNGPPATMRDVE